MLYYVTHSVLKPLLHLIYRPVIEGAENVPSTGAVLIASNHLSFVDSIVLPLVSPRRVFYLAKAEYFEGRGLRGIFLRRLFTALGSTPVSRGSGRAALTSLDASLAFLEDGHAFGIYPEGTRSRDGRLYRGRTGVAWLALTAGCPVIPVGMIGTDQIQPVGARLPRVRRVTVRFGKPVTFDHLAGQARSGKARREATDEIMDAIAALSGQSRAAEYNEPPAD
ncbi:MAG: lysophospholipid acyltransferase family protein [Nocardioidaceae bacterium]